METYHLIKKVIADNNFKVIEDNDERIVIRYQMSSIHIWPNDDDEHFIVLAITGFNEVNEDNFAEIIMKCHKMNEELKQVKFYTLNDMIIASSEIYFMDEKDLEFQIKQALSNLALAKGRFKKLNQ